MVGVEVAQRGLEGIHRATQHRIGESVPGGDQSVIDDDTWQPIGLCKAHNAPTAKAAQKARRAARRADREVVVVRRPVALCDVCGDKAPRPGYRHDACADLVEQGGDWPANMG